MCRLIPQFSLLVASQPTIMDDFLALRRGGVRHFVGRIAARGADEMHGRNSPRRRASHDNMPIMRARRRRNKKGLRQAGVATRQSGLPNEARSATERKRSPTFVAAQAAVKEVPCACSTVEMRPYPHKICHWPIWVSPVDKLRGISLLTVSHSAIRRLCAIIWTWKRRR